MCRAFPTSAEGLVIKRFGPLIGIAILPRGTEVCPVVIRHSFEDAALRLNKNPGGMALTQEPMKIGGTYHIFVTYCSGLS